MPDREQIAAWFPPGTRTRIRTLSRPRETTADVLLRALDCLAQTPADDDLAARVALLEQLVSRPDVPRGTYLASATLDPASDMVGARRRYSQAARESALALRAKGATLAEIAAEIERIDGAAPDTRNLAKLMRGWAGK